MTTQIDIVSVDHTHKGDRLPVVSKRASKAPSKRITHFTEELPFLSEEDKDWIMGRAIIERLHWS